jgi:hypothetical protein
LGVLDYGLEDWYDRWEIVSGRMDDHSWSGMMNGSGLCVCHSLKITASSNAYYFGDQFFPRRHVFFTADGTLDDFNSSIGV